MLCTSQLPGSAGLGVVLLLVTSVVNSKKCWWNISYGAVSWLLASSCQTSRGVSVDLTRALQLTSLHQSTCPWTTCEVPLYQQGSLCKGCDIKCMLSLGVSSPILSVYSYPGWTKTVFVSDDIRELYKKWNYKLQQTNCEWSVHNDGLRLIINKRNFSEAAVTFALSNRFFFCSPQFRLPPRRMLFHTFL